MPLKLPPLRLTIAHYYDLGKDRLVVGADLRAEGAWERLRLHTAGAFSMPVDRDELIRRAEGSRDTALRAHAISALLAQQRVRRLASYGVGAALVELWLARLRPGCTLILTERSPELVARVARVLPEAEVVPHDLLLDPPLEADLHLFHRIDTEFTDEEWAAILERFSRVRLLVVATEVAGPVRLAVELRTRLLKRNAVRAGLFRTRGAFEALWRATHDAHPLRFHDHEGWLLEPRMPA